MNTKDTKVTTGRRALEIPEKTITGNTEELLPSTRKEAWLIGSKYYYTGKLCKHEHSSKRIAASGACYKCQLQAGRIQSKRRHQHYKMAMKALESIGAALTSIDASSNLAATLAMALAKTPRNLNITK
ncbi:hypothetical protein [Sulfurirhabdus autotrophica]|uniref:Uncharacterized protein n=1 Tax=Sulfurirhabdus autotrophica TaxID=1706046 RepID=A0A4R3Y7S6_9PROT|nr:hypothetical protein [Sulfurirhabdus autotrophica]TCV86323.1 hypothetical protein EDC63_10710 [Sulfurirhabdus autotrophica]